MPWCGRSSAITLLASTGRSSWSTCSPRLTPVPRRCAICRMRWSRCSSASGRGGWLSALFKPHADRILFAATKADQLHHSAHDRLEAILKQLTESAIARAGDAGAEVDVIALAAIRATREALVR